MASWRRPREAANGVRRRSTTGSPTRVATRAIWFSTPVERSLPPRDELAIKLALAVTVPGVDVERLVQGQRTATLRGSAITPD